MNRVKTSMLTLALLALPVLAEEAKKTETPAPQDSPLVAAAKRSNRLGKKPTNVITNETLKKSGANAHVTTTANQKPLPLPKPTLNQPAKAVETKKAEATPEQKKDREQKVAAAVEATEEEPFADDADPAQVEKALQDAQAAAAQDQKPPLD